MPFTIVNGAKLQAQPRRPDIDVIPGLLTPGATLLAGEPKVGKTVFATQLAHAVSNGTVAAGHFVVQRSGRVLFLALEEFEEQTQGRQDRIDSDADNWGGVDYIYSLDDIMPGADFLRELEGVLKSASPAYGLVVIDLLLL